MPLKSFFKVENGLITSDNGSVYDNIFLFGLFDNDEGLALLEELHSQKRFDIEKIFNGEMDSAVIKCSLEHALFDLCNNPKPFDNTVPIIYYRMNLELDDEGMFF